MGMLAGSLSASLSILTTVVSWKVASATYVLPLEFIPSVRSAGSRGLRHTSNLNLTGGIDVGYFYTRIQLGTPPQSFSVIADTGSSLTYVPCDMCEHCGKRHEDSPFETLLSSTYEKATLPTQKNQPPCRYRRAYTEGSSVSGNLVQDSLWLTPPRNPLNVVTLDVGPEPDAPEKPNRRTILSNSRKLQPPSKDEDASQDSGVSARVTFGCVTDERGQIYRQKADGILGLADEELSVRRQLVDSGTISDTFTLCYGSHSGALVLGDVAPAVMSALPPPVVTPRSRVSPFYNVHISGISLGAEQLDIDLPPFEQSYGTILDSGTTFTYIPTDAYKVFSEAFVKAVESKGQNVMLEETVGTYCFVASDYQSHQDLAAALPGLTFHLGAQQTPLELRPKAYLFKQPFLNGQESAWCLGILDGGSSAATIGAITLRDVAVTMDNQRREIHFRPVPSCNDFAGAIAAATSGAAGTDTDVKAAPGSEESTTQPRTSTGKHAGSTSAPKNAGNLPPSGSKEKEIESHAVPNKAAAQRTAGAGVPAAMEGTTASDSATEPPLAKAAEPVPQSERDHPAEQHNHGEPLPEDPVGGQQRLYVALGGVAGILVLLAAIAFWRCWGSGRNRSLGDYTELVENKKLLDGFKFGRQRSDSYNECELAAWHNDDISDWMIEDGDLGVSRFSLGDPGPYDPGSSNVASRGQPAALQQPSEGFAALSTMHIRNYGIR